MKKLRSIWDAIAYVALLLRWAFSHECRYCGAETRRGDSSCDYCWDHGVSRSYGIEE